MMMLVLFITILEATAKVAHQSNTVLGNILYQSNTMILVTTLLLLLTVLI